MIDNSLTPAVFYLAIQLLTIDACNGRLCCTCPMFDQYWGEFCQIFRHKFVKMWL